MDTALLASVLCCGTPFVLVGGLWVRAVWRRNRLPPRPWFTNDKDWARHVEQMRRPDPVRDALVAKYKAGRKNAP